MIISASRRTDIPSYYGSWFMNRLRAGVFQVRNPYNSKMVSEILVSPENVDCIVFWTKDPAPFMTHLNEISEMGYDYFFHFTITPYLNDIEPNNRDKVKIIETCTELSEKIGKERVILRYDPILITECYNLSFHKIEFEKICNSLDNRCHKIIISFLDSYRKINKSMREYGIRELTVEEMTDLVCSFSKTCEKFSLSIETCAEEIDLSQYNIGHSSCIDGDYIEWLTGRCIKDKKIKAAGRKLCGCIKSIDIGKYDSCIHGCRYCYANSSKDRAISYYNAHDHNSPML